jgi:NDP-sugar pyrophosphorylase family protein
MKGLILSGGYGTRLRPLTYSHQKQLIPVATKPILFYAIQDASTAGVKKRRIITGPNKDQVMETVESCDWNAKIDCYKDERYYWIRVIGHGDKQYDYRNYDYNKPLISSTHRINEASPRRLQNH